jgi:E3 ubiquitin-protein ligase DOA10
LKTDKDNGKLGEEKYQVVDFAIFRLVLFPSEAVGIISIEVVNVFIEYKWTKNNFILVILTETLLSLNHYILNGKRAIRCCVPLLFIWIVNHLETSREVFNNFLWFNIGLILSEEWNNLDEKAWVKKKPSTLS